MFFRGVIDLDDYERQALEIAGTLSPEVAEGLAAAVLSRVESDGETGPTPSDPTQSDSTPE